MSHNAKLNAARLRSSTHASMNSSKRKVPMNKAGMEMSPADVDMPGMKEGSMAEKALDRKQAKK